MRQRLLLVPALFIAIGIVVSTDGPRFYDDDPIAVEPASQDASNAQPGDIGLFYDLSYNLFVTAGYRPTNTRAKNINTIDEVPDSSWFTNRVGLTADTLVRGVIPGPPPNAEQWTLIREKTSGFSAGFTAKDANGETWFISFDAPSNPEGATGAMVVATKLFWGLGYNQIETFLTRIDPKKLKIDPKATIRRPNGKRSPMEDDDLDEIFERAARSSDGTYRAAAGRLLAGKILGPFRYEGMRPDDPNDIVPHEHRRELRALRVFGAWTNLTDFKAGNTLDSVITTNGKGVVRHYLQDVGSTFGIGANGPHDWDEGWEYFYEGNPMLKRLVTLGFAMSPWQTLSYPGHYPAIGRFEGDRFDPTTWKPHAPNTAYMELRADDAFWAARRVAAFSDDLIRAAVHAGEFSDAAAEKYMADTLIKRRDKIARTYLPAINPVVNPKLDANGSLTFENAAVTAGVAEAPAGYRAVWSLFDNATGAPTRQLGETRSSTTSFTAPTGLPTTAGSYVQVAISAESPKSPAWQQPADTYFRRTADGWKLVGLERLPDTPSPAPKAAPKKP